MAHEMISEGASKKPLEIDFFSSCDALSKLQSISLDSSKIVNPNFYLRSHITRDVVSG
jgi:hypothetical protein